MNAVNKYDKESCEGWNKDIDSTLIFVSDSSSSEKFFLDDTAFQAGLFSATITVFTIESCKWLSEDPADTTARLLAQLAQHLGTPNVSADTPPFSVTASAIHINIFWFLSLIITLSAALIGILCKRWI